MKTTEKITALIAGHGKTTITRGISLLDVKNKTEIKEDPLVPVVGALYNNRIMGLEYKITRNCSIRFLTTRDVEGAVIYRKSLSLLLHAAFLDVTKKSATLKIEHSLNRGYFYSYISKKPLTKELVGKIENRMNSLVSENICFKKMECEAEDALDIFEKAGAWDRFYLLKYLGIPKVTIYELLGCVNLGQGPLVPSTGYLKLFSLNYYPPGIILIFPRTNKPGELPHSLEQKKLFQIYSEQREWSKILDVDSAGKLNRLIINRKIDDLTWVSEGLHEKKISQIADIITKNVKNKRIIFLAGPSSSGKTTFAMRLKIQLLANGIDPKVISLDNYYLPRKELPRDENGIIDFESIDSLDLELLNRHLKQLIRGEKILVPEYDFKTGKRDPGAGEIGLRSNQIAIFEGIHGMNENLTSLIDREEKFKIYISVLTKLNIDYINHIPTSTVRLIRRMVRDYHFRGYSARQTIRRWPSVRAGEDKNIFPYQEEADIMFNSSLVYEMSVLKGYVEPLLKEIEDSDEEYIQAKQLLHFISNFVYITPECVPLTSILREFIGGSGFHY
jgi:uridine kinase